MEERDFKELIEAYLPDEDTLVYCLDINPMKQVIVIDKSSGDLDHYEDRQYYYGFRNIFMEHFAEPLIENIDIYHYLLTDYPSLANELLTCAGYYPHDQWNYIKYVSNWYRDHKEGAPVCFAEWIDNEAQL